MHIAVVGSGITGIGAAWALSRKHRVTLYEAENRLGGHTRTIDVDTGGRYVPVDTGFIVYNERNYPNLVELFRTLGVQTKPSDMSFSVSDPARGLEYQGSVAGAFARTSNLVRPSMWSLLSGIREFRSEHARLTAGDVPDNLTIDEYLARRRYPKTFVSHYLLPLAAAVWSGAGEDVSKMPARTFLTFLANHGLLLLTDRPQWRTVAGGGRRYVERAATMIDEVLLDSPVVAIDRQATRPVLLDARGNSREYDQVVFTTHADTTLRILGPAATTAERRIVGAFGYSRNRAVVHSDERLMPQSRRAWASWNVTGAVATDATHPVAVTYWMNRLQSLPVERQIFVSLNPTIEPHPDTVVDTAVFSHPQLDAAAARAQQEIGSIQGEHRTWFAGAYCGYGFHEDGLQAGLTVAAQLGAAPPWADRVTPRSPAAAAVVRKRSLVTL